MSILNSLPHTLDFYNVSATQDTAGAYARVASLVMEDIPCFDQPDMSKVIDRYGMKEEEAFNKVYFTNTALFADVKIEDLIVIGSSTYRVRGKVNPAHGKLYVLSTTAELAQFSLGSETSTAHMYTTSFDNDDLESGILTVEHSLGASELIVAVYDNNDLQIIPGEVESISSVALEVDLTDFAPITGTWHVRVAG